MSNWDENDYYEPSDPELLGAAGWIGAIGAALIGGGIWALFHYRLWEVALSWLS